jgi:hypothetical protein
VVPELVARHRVAIGAVGALAAVEVAVVVAVAATHATDGVASVAVAVVLAPVAVALTAIIAGRIAGERFAVAAAAVYVVLPYFGNRYMLGVYRGTFDERALPALVGLRESLVFAVGVVCAAAVAFAPRALAAAGGMLAFVIAAAAWLGETGALIPGLHETVWSITMLRWLVLAGILGVLLRSALLATAVGGWLLAAGFWAAHRGYDDAVFWRSLAVAAPAAAVLLSSLALLVPRLRPARSRSAAPNER